MNCEQLRSALDDPAALQQPAARQHLEGCAACRELVEGETPLVERLRRAERELAAPTPDELSQLSAGVSQLLAADRSPFGWLRSRSTPVRITLAMASIVVVAVLGGVLSPRADLGLMVPWRFALELTGLFSLSAGALWVWTRPLHRPALAPWVAAVLLIGAAALPPLWMALLPAPHAAYAASLAGVTASGPHADLIARARACFLYGCAFAIPVAVLGYFLARMGRGRRWSMALPVAAAGLAAVLTLHIHCPLTGWPHLLLGHATITVFLLAAWSLWTVARRRST